MRAHAKIGFFQRPEFSYWLVTAFCGTIPLTILFAFLPVMGGHRLGVAIQTELIRHDPKPKEAVPKPEPDVRVPGIPVAYRSARTGP
jgi:hypothetical protein